MKDWYQSKTIISALVTGGIALAAIFGLDIEDQKQNLTNGFLGLAILVSSACTIYGRVVAKTAIKPIRKSEIPVMLLIPLLSFLVGCSAISAAQDPTTQADRISYKVGPDGTKTIDVEGWKNPKNINFKTKEDGTIELSSETDPTIAALQLSALQKLIPELTETIIDTAISSAGKQVNPFGGITSDLSMDEVRALTALLSGLRSQAIAVTAYDQVEENHLPGVPPVERSHPSVSIARQRERPVSPRTEGMSKADKTAAGG